MTDSEFRALEGDPTLLSSKAMHYAEIANAISRSVNTLNSIKSVEGMTSKAIDAIREEAGTVADDISKAKDRYAGTATALITYSAQLRLAQDAADVAISHIGDKEAAASAASAAKSVSDQTIRTLELRMTKGSDGKWTPEKTAGAKAEEAVEAANAELAAAQAEWHSALDVKNTAADVAIAAILEVVEGGKSNDLNDTWWDDWGAKALDILKLICDWAGVLAIFLAWVPILGQVLLVLAAVGAVLTLLEATIKAIMGDGSWWGVVGAAAGAVMSIFGGKIFSIGAKYLRASMITKAASRVDGAPLLTRPINGVGRHNASVMTVDEAAAAVAKPFKESLGEAFKKSFKPDVPEGVPNAELLKRAARDALPDLDDFSPTAMLKLNEDLLDFYRMAAKAPHLLDGPMVVQGVILGAYQVNTAREAVVGLVESPIETYLGDFADIIDPTKDAVDFAQRNFGRVE